MAYIHTDHSGQPRLMTDAAQAVVWDRVPRPFGETQAETGAAQTALRFPGQLFDDEAGYHYNYFRDYDPSTGRYLQSDPIGLAGGLNTYAYVGGNPVNFIDPYGLEALVLGDPVDGTGGACVDPKEMLFALGVTLSPLLLPLLPELWPQLVQAIAKRESKKRISQALRSIEKFLGGKPRVSRTTRGNTRATNADGTREVRLDIKTKPNEVPHANIETKVPRNSFPGDRSLKSTKNDHIPFHR